MQSFFSNIFRKKPTIKKTNEESDLASDVQAPADLEYCKQKIESGSLAVPSEVIHKITPQLLIGVAQSSGVERDDNEDSIFTLTTNHISSGKIINFGLYLVADGMGGHENGELASYLAVNIFASHIINQFLLPSISSPNDITNPSIQELMQAGVKDAHQAIREKAPGSGTTLTAAFVLGEQLTIAHVGDSRAYLVDPEGNLQLLTHDHSLVKRLEEIGQLTAFEASTHPKRNLLYRALGQGEPFEADLASRYVDGGSQLLLCSDGLWGVVPEPEITDVLHASHEPQIACQLLIDMANAAGGPDNISVVLVRFPD